MVEITPVSRALTALGVPHCEFRHDTPPRSLEQAASDRGQSPQQVVRSILFRLSQDDFAMVLVAGPGQIDWKALRHYVGQSRLTMATPEEVLAVTGYELGAVAPFGLPRPVRILVDVGLLSRKEVSLGSGARGVAVILQMNDLLSALGEYETGNFAGGN